MRNSLLSISLVIAQTVNGSMKRRRLSAVTRWMLAGKNLVITFRTKATNAPQIYDSNTQWGLGRIHSTLQEQFQREFHPRSVRLKWAAPWKGRENNFKMCVVLVMHDGRTVWCVSMRISIHDLLPDTTEIGCAQDGRQTSAACSSGTHRSVITGRNRGRS